MLTPSQVLQKYWGYDSFRPLQAEIIHSVLEGHDTLAMLPTGGGKSICFQVPSMLREGVCIVVSPLIALMKDQVFHLKQKRIPALSIYSGMKFNEVEKTLKNAAYGNFKFLYVSPERLETELFQEYLPLINLNLIAVDEAHCISQWGYDFRPPYLRIAAIRENFKDVPFLALTASATREVQSDICEKLEFRKSFKIFQQSFERPNLSYSAFELYSKENKLLSILKKVAGSGIVYCRTRKHSKQIAELLNLNGINCDFYHAGLTAEERNRKQEDWISGKTRIISCTNAFGMGIDKPDVRVVVHFDVPDALENYYQEAGRAGRDGKKAYAVLLYNESELEAFKQQVEIRFPANDVIKKIYRDLCSFLQIPANSGEGKYYDFDINTFSKNFKLNAITVNNVLKILEQEDLITYSEQFFMPPSVEFSVTKDQLNDFESTQPEYAETVKGLLRSYDGIFDFPAFINEKDLSTLIGINKESVLKNLNDLAAFGIIQFTPQKEKPQIYFLKNRVRTDELFINQKNIRKRREAYEKRLLAMIRFCKLKDECRSASIGYYFNNQYLPPCGICDNCLSHNNNVISPEEFNAISFEIKNILKHKPVSLQEIFEILSAIKRTKIRTVLKFLQEEEIVTADQEGLVKMTGK
jgi:ATP-dependent DNA helicase RecQ